MAAKQKMLAPNVTIWWIDKSGVVNYKAIKASEINAGKNISCAIVDPYTLNSTDPQTDNSSTICDEDNVVNPTSEQYEGNLTFFRDADITDNTSVFNTAFELYKDGGAEGYLVRRVGKKSDQAATTTDEVEVFGFTSDLPQSVDGADNGPPIQMTVPFIPSGEITGIITAAA